MEQGTKVTTEQVEITETTISTETPNGRHNSYLIPLAILGAGALVAGAVMFVGLRYTEALKGTKAVSGGSLDNVRPVTAKDHIIGDINAPVVIIEYSDMECPFCKEFHATMRKLASDYVPSGKIAWVYRHFPLKEKHPKAITEAEASECVAGIAGNDAFWKFTNRLFEVTPANNQLDLQILPKLAQEAGVDPDEFNDCLAERTHKDRVEADYQNALDTGGSGTPWSIVLLKNGEKGVINGAQPYEDIKKGIERVLADVQ